VEQQAARATVQAEAAARERGERHLMRLAEVE